VEAIPARFARREVVMDEGAQLTIGKPVRFNLLFKTWGSLWPHLVAAGLVLWPPIVMVWRIEERTLLSIAVTYGREALTTVLVFVGVLGVLYYMACIAGIIVLYPMLYRNDTIASWNRERCGQCERDGLICFVAGIRLKPRARRGLHVVFEDIDDVGVLILRDNDLSFEGDSIRATIRWSLIDVFEVRRTGWRGAWIAYIDFHLRLKQPLEGRESLMLRIREGKTIFHTRRRSRELRELLNLRLTVPATG
jgi:hypothetical protein